MITQSNRAASLQRWYEDEARPFLSEVASDRVEQLDQELVRLRKLRGMLQQELPICFLGTSGVGKSTLINALVAGREVILPAGGVGPLTAEATTVRYAATPRFRVSYHAPTKLNRLLFALERAYEKDLLRRGESVTSPQDDVAGELAADEREEIDELAALPSDTRPSQVPDLISVLARQAVHLIRGDQYAALPRGYVLDRLRDCLGVARRWGTEPVTDDLRRIERVKEVLQRARSEAGSPFEVDASSAGFRLELKEHAAGHLAPLVRSIEVGWNASLLSGGAVLIDLPGLGVANDEFRRVTAHWIRRARGVVLVVDRSGMSEASADLLRSSGFLNSLLHSSSDPEEQNATLLVAVVKLDATADDARASERLMAPDHVRPWAVHFEEACERAKRMVRDQLATELQKVGEQGGESTHEERALVMRRVLDGMQVHPVVAPEYRKLLADDEDDRPRIKTPEQSRIPALARAIEELVQERDERVDARLELLVRNLAERIRTPLELTLARAQHAGAAHDERTARVRDELARVADPLRREVINKQGEFRAFLRSTMPLQIEARVDAAAADARGDIIKHLARFRSMHWGTLRAAIRRGGIYDGARNVDLPADLALLFEEPVAIAWSKLIATLRKEMPAAGREYVSIVGELLAWARAQGEVVDARVLEVLQRELEAEMSGLGTVGREAIDELKARVKEELYEKVEQEVRARCDAFVRTGADRGEGVKGRMLTMLRELADKVVDAAAPVARALLMQRYGEVEDEIRGKLDKYRNPVDVAVHELVGAPPSVEQLKSLAEQRAIENRARALLLTLPVPGAAGAPQEAP